MPHHRINLNSHKLPEAQELLSIMQNLREFFYKRKIYNLRNPDMLYIKIASDGTIIIEGAGEVKLGHLNNRSLDQLESFPRNINILCHELNHGHFKSPLALNRINLPSLSARRWSLPENQPLVRMTGYFRQFVIVPANRSVEKNPTDNYKKYIDKLFKELVSNELHSLDSAKKRFSRIMNYTYFVKSSFSVEQVLSLSSYLYPRIQEAYVKLHN